MPAVTAGTSVFSSPGYNFLRWPDDFDGTRLSARGLQATLGDDHFDAVLQSGSGIAGEEAGIAAAIEALDLADKGQVIIGSKMGSTRLRVDLPKLVGLYQQGRLKLDELITARYSLAEINDAIVSVKRGEALRNVIVF